MRYCVYFCPKGLQNCQSWLSKKIRVDPIFPVLIASLATFFILLVSGVFYSPDLNLPLWPLVVFQAHKPGYFIRKSSPTLNDILSSQKQSSTLKVCYLCSKYSYVLQWLYYKTRLFTIIESLEYVVLFHAVSFDISCIDIWWEIRIKVLKEKSKLPAITHEFIKISNDFIE